MKNENWIKLEFGPSERKCVCGKCPNGKNMDLAEVFKVFDVTLVYSRKNENGDFKEAIAVLERNAKYDPCCLCWYCVRVRQNYKAIPQFETPHFEFIQLGRDAIS